MGVCPHPHAINNKWYDVVLYESHLIGSSWQLKSVSLVSAALQLKYVREVNLIRVS